MSKGLKILFIILLTLCASVISAFAAYFVMTAGATLDADKLVNVHRTVVFLDKNGDTIEETSDKSSFTKIDDIPLHVQNAFIAIEDKRFYSHGGVDFKALCRAGVKNVFSLSLKEGASTIDQQLIKNTHLTSDKTLKRKLTEIKLAKELDKKYTKREILEKYLNTIYFGNGCYGITDASEYFFGKKPVDLTVSEGAVLAGTVKAPSNYSPKNNPEKCLKRRNLVLSEMEKQGYIDKNLYTAAITAPLPEIKTQKKPGNAFLSYAKSELSSLIESDVYGKSKTTVNTSYNESFQKILENVFEENDSDCNITAIILNKRGEAEAYYSTSDIQEKRQLGSVIKPVAVYAPAIELGTIYSCSKILDEKTVFSGYSPANYKNKYYGNVSAKFALSKSLNIPAVKILSLTGVKNSLEFLKKTDVEITDADENLSVALGATVNGAKIDSIAAVYASFINGGIYTPAHSITGVIKANKNLYNERKAVRLFSPDTSYVITDMLSETVNTGTAKRLKTESVSLSAKTGTVGTEKGNSDAYCISFSPEYVLSVRYSAKSGFLLPNSVTGGTEPASTSKEIWSQIYPNGTDSGFTKPESVRELNIDEISYESDGVVEIADEFAPERYKHKELFTEKNYPKNASSRFTHPSANINEFSVNNNKICIRLCLAQYYGLKIYRRDGDSESIIYEANSFVPKEITVDVPCEKKEYEYYALPFFKNGEIVNNGEKIFLGKIKSSEGIASDDWWKNEFE